MERGGSWPTPADRVVWLHSSTEVFLLAVVLEERFQLRLSLARFDIPHDIAMGFTCDFGCPSHDLNFFIILYDPALGKHVVHELVIDRFGRPEVFVLRDTSGEAGVTIYTLVHENGVW